MNNYNVLVKLRDDGGIYLILDSIKDVDTKIFVINKLDEAGEFNDPLWGKNSLGELIKLEERSLEELKEDKRKIGSFRDVIKYKIISGDIEEIIGEIRGILLLKEII
jgi:hypothetical protein